MFIHGDYGIMDNVRQKQNTDYAKVQGSYTSLDNGYVGNGYWWLRSSVDYADWFVSDVNNNHGCTGNSVGVVPALRIVLS